MILLALRARCGRDARGPSEEPASNSARASLRFSASCFCLLLLIKEVLESEGE